MIGVATCTRLDLIDLLGAEFARQAPDLTLLRPDQVTDPAAVSFVFTFIPDDDAFTPYPNLRAVFSAGAGMDAILACPSLPPDVPVMRVEDPDQASQMAGFAAFHVVWHHRDMGRYLASQARGEWAQRIRDLSPKRCRVGVMGFGPMGRAVARGLVALGYPVAAYARRMPDPPEPGVTHYTEAALEPFLAGSNILINVLPLTPETQGLIDADFLARLPQGAALIHLGRGGQVDEGALIDALDSGQLSGASLDVFATEPLPPGDPLWSHPRVVITPHVACIPEAAAVVHSVISRLPAEEKSPQ
ncbi:2-hydroxyacid dehydrogenase [Actibacterium ureilyticum]|uniref:2-hydroxyacid dehydrogenase n=1 Tax=Actibacterium ureilyticum TaxID=1590614 RepID=UPI000BAAF5C1|nr:glyoxylate/hydroxypyruvate reductase A [Actibacterium ureilyticum]